MHLRRVTQLRSPASIRVIHRSRNEMQRPASSTAAAGLLLGTAQRAATRRGLQLGNNAAGAGRLLLLLLLAAAAAKGHSGLDTPAVHCLPGIQIPWDLDAPTVQAAGAEGSLLLQKLDHGCGAHAAGVV